MKKYFRAARGANASGRARFALAWFVAVILLAAVSGCSYLRRPASQPKAQIKSILSTTNGAVTLRALQLEVMRFADNYVALIAHESDDFNAQTAAPEARRAATKWKLEQATAAYINASGANPVINALDMVVLATLSRMVMEDNVAARNLDKAAASLLESHRKLETNAWAAVSNVLKAEQQSELRELIDEWRRRNPNQRNVAALRFREFLSALGKTPQRASTSPTSLFSLFFLDPMASMDPTTAAIEETRNTAERAMYYAQRMPALLNWQVELLTYEFAIQPETKQLLADTSRFSKSSDAFAKTAEQLPKVIAEQREAAIKQVLDALDAQETRAKQFIAEARGLATETKETLKEGNTTAVSITTAIGALDGFVKSVMPTNSHQSSTNHRPFDVLDYATAARDVGVAARELNSLLVSANASSATLTRLRQQTAADANGVVDYAFKRALQLGLLLIGAVLLAGIIYRLTTAWTKSH